MWVSNKRLNSLEQRIAGLEREIQNQQKAFIKHLNDHASEISECKDVLAETKENLAKGLITIKDEIVKAILQELNR